MTLFTFAELGTIISSINDEKAEEAGEQEENALTQEEIDALVSILMLQCIHQFFLTKIENL